MTGLVWDIGTATKKPEGCLPEVDARHRFPAGGFGGFPVSVRTHARRVPHPSPRPSPLRGERGSRLALQAIEELSEFWTVLSKLGALQPTDAGILLLQRWLEFGVAVGFEGGPVKSGLEPFAVGRTEPEFDRKLAL